MERVKKLIAMVMLLSFCMPGFVLAIEANAMQTNKANVYNSYQNMTGKDVSSSSYQNMTRTDAFDNSYQNLTNSKQKDDIFYLQSQTGMYENNVQEFLSPIERMFNGKENAVSGDILYQIGYDQFKMPSVSGNSTTGKYDSSYKLSIGERVNLFSYGDSVDIMALSGSSMLTPIATTEVSSNGTIFVQGVGPIKAENRTIQEIERDINAQAGRKYKNMKVQLAVSQNGDFSVFVYGEVNNPGKVYVGNNSSVVDALNAAGGVKKTGTLRNIKYNKNHVDIYKAIFAGNDEGIILKPNDRIFVGKIGEVVAIKNGVTVPGIYEIKQNETISDVVNYAGGLLATTQNSEITLDGFDRNKKQKVAQNIAWADIQKTKLKSGDTIAFKELYNNAENIVTIQGNIKHPSTFAYKEGMRLGDILKSEDELLEETFLSQAVIRRVSGKDNTVETIPVYLKDFFAGITNPLLQPKDVISIYKKTNSDFVDIYGCINTPKHLTYIENMTLKNVMTDIQFMESETSKGEDSANEKLYPQEDGTVVGSTENTAHLLSASDVAVEISNENGGNQLYYLYDIMINSDKIGSIKLNPNDKIFFRPLRGNEIIKTVKVSGFVKTPGVFKFIDGKRLTDMIEMAGGVTEEADIRGIVFKRNSVRYKQVELAQQNSEKDIKLVEGRMVAQYGADSGSIEARKEVIDTMREDQKNLGEKYTGQIALNIKVNDVKKIKPINNLYVQDGDDIYIPRIPTHVNVIGEVYNEMAFIYKKGARARKYIKEIGGYTPNANRFRLYRISINGRAERIRKLSKIDPGDTIVVPRKVAGNEWIDPISKALAAVANVAIAVIAVMNINKK